MSFSNKLRLLIHDNDETGEIFEDIEISLKPEDEPNEEAEELFARLMDCEALSTETKRLIDHILSANLRRTK